MIINGWNDSGYAREAKHSLFFVQQFITVLHFKYTLTSYESSDSGLLAVRLCWLGFFTVLW